MIPRSNEVHHGVAKQKKTILIVDYQDETKRLKLPKNKKIYYRFPHLISWVKSRKTLKFDKDNVTKIIIKIIKMLIFACSTKGAFLDNCQVVCAQVLPVKIVA